MRNWRIILVPLVGVMRFAPGQNVTLLPDIGVAQAEYNDALETWLHNDRDLEKDLLTDDPAQMRRRVKTAADLRDQVMVKKQAYLDLMIQRVRDGRAHMPSDDANEIPVKDFMKDLEAQQQRVLSDEARIEESLQKTQAGEESFLVRRRLEAELTELIDLQANIAARIRSLESLERAQESLRSASQGETAAQTLDRVIKIWEQERAAAARQRASWADLYKSMERLIEERAAGRKKSALDAPLMRLTAASPRLPLGNRSLLTGTEMLSLV